MHTGPLSPLGPRTSTLTSTYTVFMLEATRSSVTSENIINTAKPQRQSRLQVESFQYIHKMGHFLPDLSFPPVIQLFNMWRK